jgi:hypothetical protein
MAKGKPVIWIVRKETLECDAIFPFVRFWSYSISLQHKRRSGQYDDCHIAPWPVRGKLQGNPDVEISWREMF